MPLGQTCHRSVNAVAESFFSSLKKERIKKRIDKNREIAVADISDYIEAFYNQNATTQPFSRSESRRI
jgi:transposase InsO family protein